MVRMQNKCLVREELDAKKCLTCPTGCDWGERKVRAWMKYQANLKLEENYKDMFIKQPIIIIAIILALLGCATVPVVCPVCPPEDVIINTEAGPIYVREGLMVPENYYTQEEWNQLMKDYYDSLVPRQSM